MNKYLSYDDSMYKFDCKIDHQSDIFNWVKYFGIFSKGMFLLEVLVDPIF